MKYELLLVIPAKYSETELPGVTEGILGMVKESGAGVRESVDLGKQKLAYAIGGLHYGHLLLVKFDAEPAVAKKLNSELRLRGEVARHMLTKVILRKAPAPRAPRPGVLAEPVFVPAAVGIPAAVGTPKKEELMTLEDLDKKLEEILGKESI